MNEAPSCASDPALQVCCADELRVALRAAPEGSRLVLAAGIYAGPFEVQRSLTLQAAPGASVVLDGGGRGSVLAVAGDELRVRLTGLTLRGGRSQRGAGLLLEGRCRVGLQGCTLVNNVAAGSGGGVWHTAGVVVLRGCRVADNRAGRGGGLAVAGSGQATLLNCWVVGNAAEHGGGLAVGGLGQVELVHCTVAGNSAALGGSAGSLGPGTPSLRLLSSVLAGAPVALRWDDLPQGHRPVQAAGSLLPPELEGAHEVERRGALRFAEPHFAEPRSAESGSDRPPRRAWALASDSLGVGLATPEDRARLGAAARGWSLTAGAQGDMDDTDPETEMVAPHGADSARPEAGSASASPLAPYDDDAQCLNDLLAVVPLLLQRQLVRHWFRAARASGQLSDLFVTLEEVYLRLGGGDPGAAAAAAVPPLVELPPAARIDAALRQQRSLCSGRRAATRAAGRAPRADRLQQAFGLSDAALELLVCLAALQSDLSLYRVAAFAWGDPLLRQPSLGFLVDLVADGPEQRCALLEELGPGRPLRRWGLLALGELEGWAPRTPELFRGATLPDRALRFLRGEDGPDEGLPGGSFEPVEAPATLDALLLPEATRDGLKRLQAQTLPTHMLDEPTPLVLCGPPGVGRTALAAALAEEAGRPLWALDGARLDGHPATAAGQVRAGLREALLRHATLLVHLRPQPGTAALPPDLLRGLTSQLAGAGRCVLVSCQPDMKSAVLDELSGARLLELQRPGRALQEQLWGLLLDRHGWHLQGGDPGRLASAYDLLPVEMTRSLGLLRSAGVQRGEALAWEAVIDAVRTGIRHELAELADPVTTTLSWDDAVLPDDLRATLREVVAYARHRDTVFDTWGFGRKAGGGFGLSVLFAGPPGTGKTMTAGLIGRDLGREVYRIDLSRVVDKYVGETEKNLARLFDQAERAQVILLFDEADSLFSKRTEVRSSNDRYANLEVNYLLQRMEAYSGMSVLTTNFDMGLDAAFQRRLRFRVTFPLPNATHRRLLWRSMLPPRATVSDDIDWTALAEEFEMAGGNIKNAVLRAAMRAADGDRPMDFELLWEAALSEFRQMGRLA